MRFIQKLNKTKTHANLDTQVQNKQSYIKACPNCVLHKFKQQMIHEISKTSSSQNKNLQKTSN